MKRVSTPNPNERAENQNWKQTLEKDGGKKNEMLPSLRSRRKIKNDARRMDEAATLRAQETLTERETREGESHDARWALLLVCAESSGARLLPGGDRQQERAIPTHQRAESCL